MYDFLFKKKNTAEFSLHKSVVGLRVAGCTVGERLRSFVQQRPSKSFPLFT